MTTRRSNKIDLIHHEEFIKVGHPLTTIQKLRVVTDPKGDCAAITEHMKKLGYDIHSLKLNVPKNCLSVMKGVPNVSKF